ncbi:MAG TPA: GNAT family N-acyltransferase [Alphaproteobacteria bacterium]|nr:GNAT family N-acyltransferase [Alphaproteobacteria bacterium]
MSKVTPLRKISPAPDETSHASNLEVRLARNAAEIEAAMALRYRVFYGEMAARPSPEVAERQLDFDRYDDVADHLLVVDNDRFAIADRVVGTYRLIRRAAAARVGRFYSESEYDISQLKDYPGEILELGRSCVDAHYRTRGTMQLLWKGIADYVWKYDVALMFGCASLPGIDLAAHKVALTYLFHYHLAPPGLRARAVEERYIDMLMLDPASINPKRALVELPPLIKGYLRLGGFVGDGAVIDHEFNTTDVLILVKTGWVTEKYREHFSIDRVAKSGGALD